MNTQINKVYKDPIYQDAIISKLINIFMKKGKKSKMERIIYNTLQLIKMKQRVDPLSFVNKAIVNIKPVIELKTIRLSGMRYQVPFEMNTKRQNNMAIRWLAEAVHQRFEKTLTNKLYIEILNAYNSKGIACKKKEEIHKKAEMNKTFIHYR